MANKLHDFVWRAMRLEDLPMVVQIAEQVHLDYPESPAVFAERLSLYPAGCWVVADAAQCVHGYAITHPALLGQPPSLNTLLQQLPAQANCLYLHDVALTTTIRQFGLGAALVAMIRQRAAQEGLGHIALVAVNDSPAYWRRQGFASYVHEDEALRQKIASYDAAAAYLVTPVTPRM